MKELILIASLILVIIGGAIYWYWVQEREYNSLLKRIKAIPLVAAVLAFFGVDE